MKIRGKAHFFKYWGRWCCTYPGTKLFGVGTTLVEAYLQLIRPYQATVLEPSVGDYHWRKDWPSKS